MSEKIEWYKEVLEIEPSSKVFFPLARLLAENGRQPEAISVLRQGLEKHPEFFEARLMLIDLVQRIGTTQEIVSEVSVLGKNLCAYPGFWEAWALYAEQTDASRSLVFVLRFLAAHLKNKDLSLLDVFEWGLKAVLGKEDTSQEAPVLSKAETQKDEASSAGEPMSVAAAALENLMEEKGSSTPSEEGGEVAIEAGLNTLLEESLPVAFPVDSGENEEHFSLRTRTMAALLADQGDFQGALDIYNELLLDAQDEELRSELEMCIRNVRARMKNSSSMPETTVTPEEPLEGKHKLVKTLEVLAQRLEARAVH